MSQDPVTETLGRGISLPGEDDSTPETDQATDGATTDGRGISLPGDDGDSETEGRGIS